MVPPNKQKTRYNAKARQSFAGTTHKKRKNVKPKRSDADDIEGSMDMDASGSNAVMIDPEEQRIKLEADRKRRELLARSQDPDAAEGPISSKKRKRLDAFIARQLKKEKRQQLIADLAKSSAQVGDRSTLMSAATLGTGKVRTGQERLDMDLAREERSRSDRKGKYLVVNADRGDQSDDEDAYFDKVNERGSDVDEDEDEGGFEDVAVKEDDDHDERQARIDRARALFAQPSASAQPIPNSSNGISAPKDEQKATVVGSALALGSDGKPIIPVMKKRKKQIKKPIGRRTAWGRVAAGQDEDDDESDFDSSASSDIDSDEDEELSDAVDAVSEDEVSGSEDESASDLSDSEMGSGDETDEEERQILIEAMRQRGMLGNPDLGPPTKEDYAKASDNEENNEEPGEASLPFSAFEGEDEDQDSGEESDEESEEDDEEEGEELSKRRGLPKTSKSKGFKEWALTALGMEEKANGKDSENAEDDGVYRGPEPVGGMTQRVGDLGDGTIRGPLGQDEPMPSQIGPFAQRHYQILEEWRTKTGKKNDFINVNRSEEIQEARLKLPVVAEEERIVRTIMENMVTVLCGETGSGKTTQVPQFLFEAGFGSPGSANPGLIGVTQPRRVAALSMAARVGHELNLGQDRISHQIRYDATVSPSTSVKFMTDGVLLRELAIDFMLNKYSAVIIDEAHERSVNTDVLIGVLSRVARLRAKKWIAGEGKPLRLVIMSATLRVDDFAGNERLFDIRPPILQVEARQFPVTTHFSRRTHHEYVEEAIKKASKIHARLPNGGILIFMTGQAEISTVCQRLQKRFGKQAIEKKLRDRRKISNKSRLRDADDDETGTEDKVFVSAKDVDIEAEDVDLSMNPNDRAEEEARLSLEDGNADETFDDEEALETDDEEALETDDEEEQEYDADLPEELRDDTDKPMHILPLYSLLPSERQMQVFAPPPEGSRLVVVATNIAETSLTIPGITYVVDCGRAKERLYDAVNGIQSFEVGFISKASADQRAGRAGRTGPGHCYRLYSSNVYEEHFPQFAQPEILRMPVDNLVLMMKSMNIDNVANFPFPTAPDRQAIRRAEKLLLRLGALESDGSTSASASQYKVTSLGRSMSLFPLSTRLSKMLVQGHQHGCLPFVVALVSALSVGDPFVREESLHDPIEGQSVAEEEIALEAQYLDNESEKEKEQRRAKRSAYFKALNRFAAMSGALSDPLRLLSAVGAYEHAGGTSEFCRTNFLVPKTMEEIHKLRSQIATLVQANAAITMDLSALRSPKLDPPTQKQLNVLRQFLTAAFIDQIAVRADLSPEGAARVPMLQQEGGQGDQTISHQFYKQSKQGAKMQSTRNVAYLAAGIPSEACFIHKSSVLFHQSPPEWIIFSHIVRGQAKGDTLERKGRNWLKGVTVINPNWVYKLGSSLCSLSKPIDTDQSDGRAKLIRAAQDLKKRAASGNADSTSGVNEKTVYLVPSYGTGPAFDASERNSYVGWELPPLMAKQRLIRGKWVTEMT
ncbi:P-loop containing nucleoside triphosphate hydrolase protein [Meira miltonrushii]|uniref:RNA helicase n=1 Tax=Meira miltonrushii TaxID=1280837 RepID=A0A316V6C5_9BASI|nr:P-loop containing nucleoside triphosphate hydrolase protein [Meira miltonrushii]PWN31763.1 P-loop containing nucleoside triphosphate hydrolase protein [Meira miltonrushii]